MKKIFYEKKKITLKELMFKALSENKRFETESERFNDDSGSWLNIRIEKSSKEVFDLVVHFDPTDDSVIEDINLYKSRYILDGANQELLI